MIDLLAESDLLIDRFIDEQTTRQIITIQLVNALQPGKQYRISMKFVSLLRGDYFGGFYRSSYLENGVRK